MDGWRLDESDRQGIMDLTMTKNVHTIICSNANCGYQGPGKKINKWFGLIAIAMIAFAAVLFFVDGVLGVGLCVVAGIFYLLAPNAQWTCPRCRTKAT